MQNKPARFWLRLLAYLLELSLTLLPAFYLVSTFSKVTTLGALFAGIITLLILLLYLSLLRSIYTVVFTYYFGGVIGKLLTGIYIADENGGKLTWKRVIFRQLLSYRFALLVFGLGFWSILKDPKGQGWHDKTIGTNVFIKRPLYPLAAIILIVLLFACGYFIKLDSANFSKGPLKMELSHFYTEYKDSQKVATPSATLKNATPSAQIKPSFPAATPKTRSAPQNPVVNLGYTSSDIQALQADLTQADTDSQTMKDYYLGHSAYNQTTVNQIVSLIDQRKTLIQSLLNRMGESQPLTSEDQTNFQKYQDLTNQQNTLVKSLANSNGGY